MLRSIVIFLAGGLLGTLVGIAIGIFVYPYVFLADVVAAEQVTDRDRRTTLAVTGGFPIPAGLDVAAFGSVVIWCEQFGVLLSPATLSFAP
jgi:hypothetical protein